MCLQRGVLSGAVASDLLAWGVQEPAEEPQGSWRICEKDSDAIVSRHPGDRYWNDLLG